MDENEYTLNTVEGRYYAQLILAWDSYEDLMLVNRQLVEEIQRLNKILKERK